MNRLYRLGFWMGLAIVGSGSIALAQEHGTGESPTLFSGTIWTSIWTLVIFLLLLVVLGRFAWRPLLDALRKREETIQNDLEAAKRERREAERTLEEYRRQIAQAQAEAQELLKKASVQAEQAREQILSQGQQQARMVVDQAKQQIEAAKQQALRDLYARSVELAGNLAAKILQREVNSEDHRVLIQKALEELPSQENN